MIYSSDSRRDNVYSYSLDEAIYRMQSIIEDTTSVNSRKSRVNFSMLGRAFLRIVLKESNPRPSAFPLSHLLHNERIPRHLMRERR